MSRCSKRLASMVPLGTSTPLSVKKAARPLFENPFNNLSPILENDKSHAAQSRITEKRSCEKKANQTSSPPKRKRKREPGPNTFLNEIVEKKRRRSRTETILDQVVLNVMNKTNDEEIKIKSDTSIDAMVSEVMKPQNVVSRQTKKVSRSQRSGESSESIPPLKEKPEVVKTRRRTRAATVLYTIDKKSEEIQKRSDTVFAEVVKPQDAVFRPTKKTSRSQESSEAKENLSSKKEKLVRKLANSKYDVDLLVVKSRNTRSSNKDKQICGENTKLTSSPFKRIVESELVPSTRRRIRAKTILDQVVSDTKNKNGEEVGDAMVTGVMMSQDVVMRQTKKISRSQQRIDTQEHTAPEKEKLVRKLADNKYDVDLLVVKTRPTTRNTRSSNRGKK